MHEVPPPVLLDVVLELHAERAVVVKAVEPVIDFGRRKHEAAPLAEAHLWRKIKSDYIKQTRKKKNRSLMGSSCGGTNRQFMKSKKGAAGRGGKGGTETSSSMDGRFSPSDSETATVAEAVAVADKPDFNALSACTLAVTCGSRRLGYMRGGKLPSMANCYIFKG